MRSEEIRKGIFNVLGLDPRIKDVLKGDREGSIRSMEIYGSHKLFVSSDLTAASDRIP
jgi:hypothetical protein